MRKKLCVYPSCKSDSRYFYKEHMNGVFFIPFPKAKKSFEKCQKWINWLNRADYPLTRVNDNTYLCSKHFVGGKGPTLQFPDPIHNHSEYVSILKRNNSINGTVGPTLATCEKNNAQLSEITQCTESQDREDSITSVKSSTSVTNDCTTNILNTLNSTVTETSQADDSNIPALDLQDLVARFSFPIEWAASQVNSGLKIYKFKGDSDLVMYSLKLDHEFSATYEVLGKPLKNIDTYKLPCTINSKDTLTNVLLSFNECKPCSGNTENEMRYIFDNRPQKNGFKSSITGGLHSVNCELLMRDSSRKRCFFCTKQRLSLQVTISRKKKKTETSINRYSNLNEGELAQKLRQSKNTEILLKRKLRRLQKKMKKQINKRGSDQDDE